MLTTFAGIPDLIRERVRSGERVLLVLLDGFGHSFLDRHRAHPLVRELTLTPLRAQFPSTTAAHVTTVHFGVPVQQHGLYEWSILEPSLERIINPLRYRYAGSAGEGELVGILNPATLAPGPTFYATLEATTALFMPDGIANSAFMRMAGAGASMTRFDDLETGLAEALRALGSGLIGYAHLYWPHIDTVGHHHGPRSEAFRRECGAALDALAAAMSTADPSITVLVTADHGQVDVHPDRVDLLDDLWPELGEHLQLPRLAGSPRDAFLHVRAGSESRVIEELGSRLEGRADVVRAAELFVEAGPRLTQRLAQVAVLPVAGRSVALRGCPGTEVSNLGSHGGASEDEMATYLGELQT